MSCSPLFKCYPDFPQPGVCFRDMTPLLQNVEAWNQTLRACQAFMSNRPVDGLVGVDSRGFLIAGALSTYMKKPALMARKKGKLPGEVVGVTYGLEYASSSLEMQRDSIVPGQSYVIVDDILATGGTVMAVMDLITQLKGRVVGVLCLGELTRLNGRQAIAKHTPPPGVPVWTIWSWSSNEPTPEEDGKTLETCQVLPAQIWAKELPRHPSPVPARGVPLGRTPDSSLPIVLVFHSSCAHLAYQVMNTEAHTVFEPLAIDWNVFPDQAPNIRFPSKLASRRVVFLMSMEDHSTFANQLSVAVAIARQDILSLDIGLFYFAYGTMERVTTEGIVATADTYAHMFSSLPSTRQGPVRVHVFDLHNLTTRWSFSDQVRYVPHSAFQSVLLTELSHRSANVLLVFPDDGSYKRNEGLFDTKTMPFSVCGKTRQGDQRIIHLSNSYNWPRGFTMASFDDVYLVDDLVQTGGTLYECLKLLQKEGARRVSAFVTHGVFPNNSHVHFLPGGKYEGFHRIYVSSTLLRTMSMNSQGPFRTYTVIPTFVNYLLRHLDHTFDGYMAKSWHIASSAGPKVQALEWLSQESGGPKDWEGVKPVSCESGVSPQPLGVQEIQTGVENRLKKAIEAVTKTPPAPTRPLLVWAVENGIVEENGMWVDRALVQVALVQWFGDVPIVVARRGEWTSDTPVPKDIYDQWQKLTLDSAMFSDVIANPVPTIGQAFQSIHPDINPQDWHGQVNGGGNSRVVLLYQTMKKLYENLGTASTGRWV